MIYLTEEVIKLNDTNFQQKLTLTNNLEDDDLALTIDQYFGFNGTDTVWWRAYISNSDIEYDIRRENEFNLNTEIEQTERLNDHEDIEIITETDGDYVHQNIYFRSHGICVYSNYDFS